MKKVSIRIVARACGAAPCTVSRALSGFPSVSDPTRERIIRVARELGYSGTRDKKMIALATAETENFGIYDCVLITELVRTLTRSGYGVHIITGENLRELERCRFDGIVSILYNAAPVSELSEKLNLHLVCVNNYSRHLDNIYSVSSDNKSVIGRVVGEFAGKGHRRIGMLLPREAEYSYSWSQRKRFFLETIAEDRRLEGVIFRSLDDADLSRVTALFFPYESKHLEIYAQLREKGISVPDDLSLIGWENPVISQHLSPSLTTFAQDYRSLSREAVKILSGMLGTKGSFKMNDILVPYIFHERKSVRRLPETGGIAGADRGQPIRSD